MVAIVSLQIEAAGCLTVCRHCWAQGTPYGWMPVEDVALVLDQAATFFEEAGVSLLPTAMHEAVAHPDATRLLPMFQEAGSPDFGPLFEPLSTTAVPLATRPDWREVLDTCRSLGTSTVVPAIHGVGEVHDRIMHREGAYRETLLGIERSRSAGLEVGCNVFLTKENVGQFDQMVDDLLSRGVGELIFEPAFYRPTGRGRRYEALRPELSELQPLAEKVLSLSIFWKEQWTNLESLTEAAWMRGALSGEWSARPMNDGEMLELICRPNLDLHSGASGVYRRKHGNLRERNAEAVWHDALEYGARNSDEVWFGSDPLPPVRELAERFGDPQSRRVHFSSESMRFRWLDTARQETRAASQRPVS